MATKLFHSNNRSEINSKIIEILTSLLPHTNPNDLKNHHGHLIYDLDLDSVAFLQLIMDIEKTFRITIANHELDMDLLTGLDSLTDLVQGKLYEVN